MKIGNELVLGCDLAGACLDPPTTLNHNLMVLIS